MANFAKSNNFLVNSLMLPGMYVDSTYTFDDFPHMDLTNDSITECTDAVKRNGYVPELKYTSSITYLGRYKQYPLRLLYIPIDRSVVQYADAMNVSGTHMPAILQLARNNEGASFIIHFHGNACDAAQVGVPARVEARSYNAHYLIVEYPGYGLADGSSSESMLNSIAFSTYKYVVGVLKVPPDRIIIYGRSIGCGIAVHLASRLQAMNLPVAAMVLHSPYTSIRDVAQDILGGVTSLFCNRWENWEGLCAEPSEKKAGLAPAAPPGPSPTPSPTTSPTPLLTPAPMSPTSPGASATWTDVATPVPRAQSDLAVQNSCRLSEAEVKGLSARYLTAPCQVIQSAVLLLHADNDQIIDHHHASTMNLIRNRNNLSSELFTQRSTLKAVKDHNMFDYEKDVIRPIQRFLTAKGLYVDHSVRSSVMSEDFTEEAQKAEIVLDLQVVTAATVAPAQYTSRIANLRKARKTAMQLEQKNEENVHTTGEAPVPAPTTLDRSVTSPESSDSSSRSASSDGVPSGATKAVVTVKHPGAAVASKGKSEDSGPRSVIGLVCGGWTLGKCCRCCICCFPCFFTECSMACCSDACKYLYYCATDEEPDFEYSTKIQRRMSGGIANEDVGDARLSIEKLQTTQPSQTPVAQQMEGRKVEGGGASGAVGGVSSGSNGGSDSKEIDGVLKFFARPFNESPRTRDPAAAANAEKRMEDIPIQETSNPMLGQVQQGQGRKEEEGEEETDTSVYLPG